MDSASLPLYVRILLDRSQGIVLEVVDAQGEHQQLVTLDGTTLTLQVQGPTGHSTFVQTAERIALKAREVDIEADTVRICSQRDTTLKSQGRTTVDSGADLTLKSTAGITQQCGADLAMSAQAMSVNARKDVSVRATGGLGLFGVSDGVKVGGSAIDLTALRTSVTGVELGLLGFDVKLGTPGADVDFGIRATESEIQSAPTPAGTASKEPESA